MFLLSAWKKDLVGGAGLRQVIFHPCTPWPWPRDARPVRGDLERAGEAVAATGPEGWMPVFYKILTLLDIGDNYEGEQDTQEQAVRMLSCYLLEMVSTNVR